MHEGIRKAALHALAIASLLLGAAATPTAQAAVKGRQASFVVDANTGAVLHADKATDLRYPASLTKMMTLYLVFERIEDGRLTYHSKITATPRAAGQPPSRIGLKPGDRITVRQAVHALVTKSANDVATAIAEHIAGSEPAFARLMTRKARQLGMRNTVFRNASGLPDPAQVTTARDMAQLALRLRDHFPNHFGNFRTRVFHYKGRRYRNHNTLLGRYRGVDGIKTGYTRASGFNLVTSLRQSGRNVVAVVMGGKTARKRNATMRRLLQRFMPLASQTRSRTPHVRVAARKRPHLVRAPRQIAASTGWQPRVRVPKRKLARPAARNVQRPGTLQTQAVQLAGRTPGRIAQAPHRQASLAAAGGNTQIQVGAYLSIAEAQNQLQRVKAKAGPLLAGARPVAIRAVSRNREVFRARYTGFAADTANATCKAMQRIGIECFVARQN